jgi:hypothetical protein
MDSINKTLNSIIAVILGIVGWFYVPAATDAMCEVVQVVIILTTTQVVTLPDLTLPARIVFAGYSVFAACAVWVWPDNRYDPQSRYNPHDRQSR